MKDNFYDRLDFYRMLETGLVDLDKIAGSLAVDVKTLRRWKHSYDPHRGSFGAPVNPTASTRPEGKREDILEAMHNTALEGNVPAAKLLLAEYTEPATPQEEVLTVEKAI